MKVSVNWVKQFIDIDVPLKDLVERIGAQLGAVEEVIDLGKRYKGVVIVRVVTCEKHPDADKLWVCQIDDGGIVKGMERNSQGFIQIVTGAPNAAAGMLAAWIPPGSVVPSEHADRPVLESREFRGLASHGMLASPKELGLGDDHGGLLHLDGDFEPGTNFAKAYRLDDHVIDIENKMFTHRPDLFGIIGIAREIAAIHGQSFQSPDWYTDVRAGQLLKGEGAQVLVKNEAPELVPRFSVVVISGVSVGPSPIWLRSYLIRAGIRPINNIVDLTNFVMYETGQPLHAYDLDKISGGRLIVRKSKPGESLTLLDGKEIKLEKNEITIADEEGAIGLGGVMGGLATEVDEQTANVLLEAGNFNMNSVRRSAMAHGLFTEAATRFAKNQSPWQTVPVLAKLADDIMRMAGGEIPSSLSDSLADDVAKPKALKASTDFINQRLGMELTAAQMTKLLESVEMQVNRQGDDLVIVPPFWRTDIAIAEDIVEEVGRLYGYDHLPLSLPAKDLTPPPGNAQIDAADRVRQLMSSAGANELLTYSFVHGSLIEAAGQDKDQAIHIRNALSPDLQYFRMSMAPSLLEKVRPNIKAGSTHIVIFEIGSAHIKGINDSEKLPRQLSRLAIVAAAAKQSPRDGSAYYLMRRYCEFLSEHLGIPDVSFAPLGNGQALEPTWRPVAKSYDSARSAVIRAGKDVLGIAGEPSPKLRHSLKLPAYCAVAELDMALLAELSKDPGYSEPNRFPPLSLDICFRTKTGTTYAQLENLIKDFLTARHKKDGIISRLEPIDIFQSEKDNRHKQTAWHLLLQHPDKTLTTDEANGLVEGLSKLAKTKLDAHLV